MSLRILLLSGYDASSHQRWRLELQQQLPHHRFTQLGLPPRYFNWRIRGNSLTWAFSQREILEQSYDLVIATSMVDLSSLRGFVPTLARIPTLLYFHENQFSYPASTAQFTSVEPQMITLYSALCADLLLFNSEFNRATFIAGVEQLLHKLPDFVPAGLPALLNTRSQILSVPLQPALFTSMQNKAATCSLVWNHRWEYDKGPDRLLAMLKLFFTEQSPDDKVPAFTLHIVGQQFRQQPSVFGEIKQLLEAHGVLGQWGYIESADDYLALLRASHFALSTALHDFQGLAVLEAVAAGCVPIVPDRQAYPEWFGSCYCYTSDLANPAREAASMARMLKLRLEEFAGENLAPPPEMTRFSWTHLGSKYDRIFCGVASMSRQFSLVAGSESG